MSTEAQLPLATFLESDLAPFVAQVVGKQDCEVVEWHHVGDARRHCYAGDNSLVSRLMRLLSNGR